MTRTKLQKDTEKENKLRPATPLERDAMSEAFLDTEKLIFDTVHKFVKRYGGRFDDYIEFTAPMFVTAFRVHRKEDSSFPTCLRWVVWKQLLDILRNKMRHHGKVEFRELDPDMYAAKEPPEFDLAGFLLELSPDGYQVAMLVLNTPKGLASLFEREGAEPAVIRRLLREYLSSLWRQGSGDAGAPRRVEEAFREIRRALEARSGRRGPRRRQNP